jgi:hypothetical protein
MNDPTDGSRETRARDANVGANVERRSIAV